MYPALRDGDFIKNNGQVFAVPIAWGDGPYIYNPDTIKTPPKSIAELLDPGWTNPLVMFDDPIMPFHTIAWSMNIDPNTMTKDQLAQVADKTRVLVKKVVAFAQGYQDATDYLVRGEADLSVSGWEAMLTWANEKGKTLAFSFFSEAHGGGWCDSWTIPENAKNVDAAYAAIGRDDLAVRQCPGRDEPHLGHRQFEGARHGRPVREDLRLHHRPVDGRHQV